MKRNCTALTLLLLASLMFASCATQPAAGTRSKAGFQEAQTASVVLHYSGWEHINMIQPEYRKAGFLVPLSPKEIGAAFDELGIQRDMAVVVLRWDHRQQDLNELVGEWKAILKAHGFERIVCLEAGLRKQIQGLQVIDDTQHAVDSKLRTASL